MTDCLIDYSADERRRQEKYKSGHGVLVASDDEEEGEFTSCNCKTC